MKLLFTALLCSFGSMVAACENHPVQTADGSTIMNVKCPVKFCFGTLSDSYEYDYRGKVYKCSSGHKFVIGR